MRGIVSATYSPKGSPATGQLADCLGKKYDFIECYVIGGVREFEPVDKNFPSSNPVPETDLIFEEVEERTDCYYCWVEDGITKVSSDPPPDGREGKLIVAPTIEIAGMVFETELKLGQ